MKKQTAMIIALIALGVAGVWAILGSGPSSAAGDHEHHGEEEHAEEADMERGPHGGRLLRDGAFSVELQIFEDGVAPQFRLYGYREGQPIDSQTLNAEVALTRLGGRVDRFAFTPQGEFLQGQGVVEEPHSFDVAVSVRSGAQAHTWKYPSYESRVKIPAAAARAAGVMVAEAGPVRIAETLLLYGSIIPDERRVRSVGARFPGVAREVRVNLGDRVRAGAILAVVESNESLETYPVPAPISGVIISRMVNPGEKAGDAALFTVADLSVVIAELAVFRRDLPKIRVGQSVRVKSDDGAIQAEGTVTFISPVGSGESQSVKLRVTIDNADGLWQPGIFVTGEVQTATAEVPVAVARSALQKLRDFDVVFASVGDTYEPRMLDLGRADREHVEVLSGITAGDSYVVTNSFLIKAEIGKAGAGHDH
jgi:cobalt-zinc-cadmium efflux system membrane fusion protein